MGRWDEDGDDRLTWTLHEGDCLEVMRGMPAESVDAIITDPPYGIDYQSAWRSDKSKWKPKIANDKQPFIWWLHDAYRLVKEGGILLCFCRWDVQEAFKLAIEWAGFTLKSQVIWDRGNHGMGDLKASFAPQHDVVWFAVKGAFRFPDKRPSTIIKSMRLSGEQLLHPNEKPVDLMEQLIRATTKVGDAVLDPFSGSGSTLAAADGLNRNAIGIELDPKYCNIIRERMNALQGRLII